jgi:hypothetical protein
MAMVGTQPASELRRQLPDRYFGEPKIAVSNKARGFKPRDFRAGSLQC